MGTLSVVGVLLFFFLERTKAQDCSDTSLKMDPGMVPYSVGSSSLRVELHCYLCFDTSKQYSAKSMVWEIHLDNKAAVTQWVWGLQMTSTLPSSDVTFVNRKRFQTSEDPFKWKFQVTYDGTVDYSTNPPTFSSPLPTGYCSATGSTLTTTAAPPATSSSSTTTTTGSSTSSTSAPTTAISTASPSTSAPTSSTSKATTSIPTTTTSTLTTTSSSQESTTTTQEQANVDICQQEVTEYNGRYNLHEVLCKSILFYEAQRAGKLPTNQRVLWRKDSALNDGSDNGVDLSKGWLDAGDYMKFNLPMSMSLTTLTWGFIQWSDAYDAAGQTDSMLDSIRWPLDYLYNCWQPETNTFYGQVGSGNVDHSVMERVEEMTTERPSWPTTASNPGTEVSASGAAALAAGSIAFSQRNATYSALLLSAAQSLFEFADTYRGTYTNPIPDAANFYNSWSGYGDELVLAAAMLHKATGDVNYLSLAEELYNEFLSGQTFWSYDWDNQGLGATLLLFQATQDPKYSAKIVRFLNDYGPNGGITYTNKGLAWRAQWGSLRYSANAAFAALMASESGIPMQSSFLDPEKQIGYMLGDTGRSFVVGFGTNPPRRPHHKSSTCAPSPAPCGWVQFSADTDNYYTLYGALVGGPDSSDNYADDRNDYIKNEVATDYNAGFQSAVAGLISRGLLRR